MRFAQTNSFFAAGTGFVAQDARYGPSYRQTEAVDRTWGPPFAKVFIEKLEAVFVTRLDGRQADEGDAARANGDAAVCTTI